MQKNDPKVIRSWCMYDWANSVYSLNITSSIFPAYYLAVTKNEALQNKVTFLGLEAANSVWYTYSLSMAFLTVVILSPFLAGIADYFNCKKLFMRFFCTLGSFACMGLFFFTKGNANPGWGLAMLILATIGYAGSLVFYNAFLPEISTPDTSDKISARGFSYGYIGSVILMVINIAMILFPQVFGLKEDSDMPARISFLMVGIWWIGFAEYAFRGLPETKKDRSANANFLTMGYSELQKVFLQITKMNALKRFLMAFLLYSMGTQTVMYVANLFGEKELHLETTQLIVVVLILQLIAIFGAHTGAWLSQKTGNLATISLIVVIWIFICLAAYFVHNGNQFYLLAVVVGFVMGAVQALSRSTYSKMIPPETEDHASFFSFYEMTEKTAIVLGTFSYGLVDHLTGNMRNSIVTLGLYFAVGLFFLYLTSKTIKNETPRTF